MAIGDVAKVDGIAKANIQSINAYTILSGVTPPLDTYTGADYAYSVRLVRTAYTGAIMRVIRGTAGGTGHQDEADISLYNGAVTLDSTLSNVSTGVNSTTLGQFINVGTVGGFTYTNPDNLTTTATAGVIKWYDQSTNGLDLTADNANLIGLIHDGFADTDLNKDNGIPIIKVTNLATMTSGTYSYSTNNTVFCAIKRSSTGSATVLSHVSGVLGYASSGSTSSADFGFGTTSYYQNGSEFQSSSPTRDDMYTATQTLSLFSILFGSNSATYVRLGRLGSAAMYSAHELIGYPNQTVSRTGVETNLNDYYGIF